MDDLKNIPRPKRVGVFPIDGFSLLSYAATVEMFRGANRLGHQTLYEVIVVAPDAEPVQSSGAASVTPNARIGDQLALDYLFVTAGGDPALYENEPVFSWLRRMSRSGTILGGVSGGPVVLAKAGLMDGRRMTLHWEHAAALAEHSPHLLIERTLYVIDRDRVTCAGGTAPLDLMHALISEHHGAGFARQVSDWFMHTEIRPSIGPQRSSLAARVGSNNRFILDAVKMMDDHMADPLTLAHLSDLAGISPRQMNRLFKEKLDCTTMAYYRQIRLEMARNLLQSSPLPLTEIALATGFANSSHFSRVFKKHFGHSPSSTSV